MKQCSKCDLWCPDSATFCKHCNAEFEGVLDERLDKIQDVPPVKNIADILINEDTVVLKESANKKIFGCVVYLLICGGFSLYFLSVGETGLFL